jgi:alpha-ribazole phosphatase
VQLILARHGATLNNAEQRYTGQSDAGLSALGLRQAEALAERLASVPLDCIVTSDLRRARTTAECIAACHDLPLCADPDLREMSLGAWEGATRAEALARDPERLRQWEADPLRVAPPGGETLEAVRERVARALRRWQAHAPEGRVLWVTHGGIIGVLICHALGLDLRHRQQFRRDNAALTRLELRADGAAVLVSLNDTHHLRHLAGDALAEPGQVL